MSFVLSKATGFTAIVGCPPAVTVPDGYTSPFLTDPVSKGTWFGAAWIAPTLINSWVNFGSGQQVCQYRKIGDIVYIRGVIKNGTSSTVAFTLPVGFRPGATDYVAAVGATATPTAALASVDASGNVQVYCSSTTAVAISGCFSVAS